MLALVIVLLVVIGLLAMDDVRMRMQDENQTRNVNGQQPQSDELVAPVGDNSIQLSAEPDIVYPDPLPSSMTDQGINWASNSWSSESSGEPTDGQNTE